MSNNLTTTNKNAKLVLNKSKSLLDITNKLLSKKESKEVVESLKDKLPTKVRKISDDQAKAIEFEDEIEAWIDKDTGLMWEVKTKENIEHEYVWSEEWIGSESLSDNAEGAFSYAQKLNELSYAGFSDWRVPTKKELETLLTRETVNDHCIKIPLSKNSISSYWSSTTREYSNEYSKNVAFIVDFYLGIDSWLTKDYSTMVRCVREGQ